MSDLVESIFSGMPTVGSKKSSFVCDIDQTDSWVVSYPRKLWTPGLHLYYWGDPSINRKVLYITIYISLYVNTWVISLYTYNMYST